MMHPGLIIGLSWSFAAAAGVLGQLDPTGGGAGTDWTQTGALGLLGASGLLLVYGVLRGELIHVKNHEREKAMEDLVKQAHDLADTAHAREQVHERFMTAAVDRLVAARQERERRDGS